MSTEFIERYCSRHFQKYPNKSKEDVLKTLTHLYLNGRKLETIVGSKAIHSLVTSKINHRFLIISFPAGTNNVQTSKSSLFA